MFHLPFMECEWRWNKEYDTLSKEIKEMMVYSQKVIKRGASWMYLCKPCPRWVKPFR